MTVRVIIVPEAEARIDEIDAWWRTNRRAAKTLFRDEVTRAVELLQAQPKIGSVYRRRRAVRRLLLSRTEYFVYYQISQDTIFVVSVWSARRGRGPKLPRFPRALASP